MTSFSLRGMRGHNEKMLAKFYPRTHNMGLKRTIYDQIGGFSNLRHGQDIEFVIEFIVRVLELNF